MAISWQRLAFRALAEKSAVQLRGQKLIADAWSEFRRVGSKDPDCHQVNESDEPR